MSKFELPATVKIFGQTWSVEVVPLIDEDKDTLGQCDEELRILYIKEILQQECAFETILHEMFHGYTNSIPIAGLPTKFDEPLAQYFAAAVIDLMRSNPELCDQICKKKDPT